MHPDNAGQIAGSAALVHFDNVSKWYGNVIGLNNVSLSIGPGVTGLLGPNGAGKSTFLQLVTGQLKPSKGSVTVLGEVPWNNPWLFRHIGLCPEQDAFYEWMTGWQFVHTFALLRGFTGGEAKEKAEQAIARVSLQNAMNRAIGGYSRGMRQRIKIAQSLVHDPQVLFLDEPFTGTDPIARRELMDIILKLAGEGKSIVLSSHVLHEVQGLTQQIVLIHRGRLVAEGNMRDIRNLIDKYPHRIVLICDRVRDLATSLAIHPDVLGMTVSDKDQQLVAQTKQPDLFYSRLPSILREKSLNISELYSEDDNMEAVFKYLTN